VISVEYEAKFLEINRENFKEVLKKANAELVRPEFLQRRVVFGLPEEHEIPYGRLRVRDEGDKITMSMKILGKEKIDDQKEICLQIDDFENGILFLTTIGCKRRAFVESKRELWKLNGAEITIDEWPFLEPYVEIESDSEESVRSTAEKLGLDYTKGIFGGAGQLYARKYGVSEGIVNEVSEITFSGTNPFLKK
jgi:adenylate cyclase, class 2